MIVFDAYADSGEAAVLCFDAQPLRVMQQIEELMYRMIGARLPEGTKVATLFAARVTVYIPPQADFEQWLRNVAMEVYNAHGIRTVRGFMKRSTYLEIVGYFGA